jgi:hypothetical protein
MLKLIASDKPLASMCLAISPRCSMSRERIWCRYPPEDLLTSCVLKFKSVMLRDIDNTRFILKELAENRWVRDAMSLCIVVNISLMCSLVKMLSSGIDTTFGQLPVLTALLI